MAREAKEEIRQLLNKINTAWLQGAAADLNNYFAEEVVFKGPSFVEMARGRAACVQTYLDFVKKTNIKEFHEGEPHIDVFSSYAVATCGWTIVYDMNHKSYRETGHDLFVLERLDGQWKAVWRAIIPETQIK